MCTLCLSDMGELRDEWLHEPQPALPPAPTARPAEASTIPACARCPELFTPELETAA